MSAEEYIYLPTATQTLAEIKEDPGGATARTSKRRASPPPRRRISIRTSEGAEALKRTRTVSGRPP